MAEDKGVQKTAEGDAEGGDEAKESKVRWLIGWVLIPGLLLCALFLAGVHVGANFPDMWLSRLIGWLGG